MKVKFLTNNNLLRFDVYEISLNHAEIMKLIKNPAKEYVFCIAVKGDIKKHERKRLVPIRRRTKRS